MRRLFIFFLLSIASIQLAAQSSPERLDDLLTELQSQNTPFNGNVLVAQQGKAIYRRSFGYANLDTKQALDSATVFRLASVSKQFTALGIAILENDGKLAYDDPLAKHIPELGFYEGVTLRQLIHHYGGLPDYMSLVAKKGDHDLVYDNEMIIALIAAEQPKAEFAPGTSSSYSNSGYAVLAAVIARVSGQSYGDFLSKRIFQPLGMGRTVVNYPLKVEDKNVAAGFEKHPKSGKFIRVDNGGDPFGYGILAGIVGDGAVFSTTDDLLRYHLGMQTDKVLPADKRAVLVSPGSMEPGPDKGYAFGQQISVSKSMGRRISHSGSWAGALTYLERYPETDDVIIVLSNTNADFAKTRMLARQLLAGEDINLPRVFTPVKVSAADLQPYPGDYKLSDEMTLTISTKGRKLRMQPTGQRNYLMTAYAADGFFLEGTTISIQFNKNEKGEVTDLTFEQDGVKRTCVRE